MTSRLVFKTFFGLFLIAIATFTASAQPRRALENLDRGLIASVVSNGVHLNWRLFIDEVSGFSATGLTGTDFNLYRDGQLLASVTNSTNYRDLGGTPSSQYFVRAVVHGVEVDQSKTITPWANANFIEVPLHRPPNHTYPTGATVAYVANDMSVGDVDSDGQYEYFVKWEANPQDVIGKGFTGGAIIDCYKLDGTLLYRIDLGKNIRAGAHYTQFLVYDFDGDGKAEIIFKTAPGTATIKYAPDGTEVSRNYITMPASDLAAGWSHSDDYRCTFATFADHLKETFAGWSTHPEVLAGHWPARLQSCWNMPADNPLFNLDPSDPTDDFSNARRLVTYYVDVYAPSRSTQNQLRQFVGYIFKGPEYLTIFNGETGAEMQTIPYKPGRDDSGLMWGDYAGARIEPCNRVDRLQGCVASLDGQRAFAVFARGYYTRCTIVSYTWDGHELKEYWTADSGYPIYPNPFNTNPHGVDGRNPSHAKITTQGAHTLGAADVDGDGFDEIINGSSTIDHDGSVLYSSFSTINQGPNAGLYKRLGHGDSIHVTDIDPNRPGLEIFMCHEEGTNTNYGISMRDAKTGEFIWGFYSGVDTGRCMVGDINPNIPGLECWGFQNIVRRADNGLTTGSSAVPSTNQNIKWAADMSYQFLNGVNIQQSVNGVLSNRFSPGNVVATNNGTKGNACLVADVFGDWREEVIFRRADNTGFRIYFATDVSTRKLFTLMHDRQYRMDVARQNDGYNQPAYTEFYFATDTNFETLYRHITKVTEVHLAPSALTLEAGESTVLHASVFPENAANPHLVWTVADDQVARVSSAGVITGVGLGSTTVTATSEDNQNTFDRVQVSVVPATLGITRSGYSLNRRTGRIVQSVTVTNLSGASVPGPIHLAADELSRNTTLFNAVGATKETFPAGSPYLMVTGDDLAGGASSTVVLEFTAPAAGGIVYTARTLKGPGAR